MALRSGEAWRLSELSGCTSVSQWYQCALEEGGELERLNYELYVDLRLGLEQIRRSIRKSYKPLISSGLKNWNVNVLNSSSDTTWSKFRSLHRNVSGRVTRPDESWDIQHKAIERVLSNIRTDGTEQIVEVILTFYLK